MENHQIELGKSKKLHELRSGPYIVTNKTTKVNHELISDSNISVKKVAHQNRIVE